MAEWIKKQNAHTYSLQETYLKSKNTHRLKMNRWKRIFYGNGSKRKAGVAIL